MLVNRIIFQFHGHSLETDSSIMITYRRGIITDTRKQRFSAAGISREKMRFDRSDNDNPVRFGNGPMQHNRTAIIIMAHVDQIFGPAAVVNYNTAAQ